VYAASCVIEEKSLSVVVGVLVTTKASERGVDDPSFFKFLSRNPDLSPRNKSRSDNRTVFFS
jgi:hypothetical protein